MVSQEVVNSDPQFLIQTTRRRPEGLEKVLSIAPCTILTSACMLNHSVMSDSLWPYGLQPARLWSQVVLGGNKGLRVNSPPISEISAETPSTLFRTFMGNQGPLLPKSNTEKKLQKRLSPLAFPDFAQSLAVSPRMTGPMASLGLPRCC